MINTVNEVVILTSYTLYTMVMTGLRWSLFVECLEWLSCWRALDAQAVRLYCCVLAWNWRFNTVWGRNFILVYYTTMVMTILYWTFFDYFISWTDSVYVCIAWIWHILHCWLTQYEVVISCICAVQYTAIAITTLRWSWFVQCIKCVSLVLALNKQYVRFYYLNLTLLPVVDAV